VKFEQTIPERKSDTFVNQHSQPLVNCQPQINKEGPENHSGFSVAFVTQS